MDAHALEIGPAPGPPRLSARSVGIVLAYGLTLMTVRFGPTWALTYHEVFFAQPSREMLDSGDWVVPRMLGEATWQKPPMTSWLIAASMGLFRSRAEWVVRLPSLLADLLTALIVGAIAARWHGDRVGRVAGLVQLTTFYSLFQSRLAEADMPLCASVTVAMAAFASGVIGRPPGSRVGALPLLYFASAAVAFLIKGPLGLALVGLPCGVYAIASRRRLPWRFLLDPAGWVVGLIGTLTWPVAAYRRDPAVLDHLWLHNMDRFSGGLAGGAQGPLFYVYMVPLILLPWTPFAIEGLVRRWRAARPEGPEGTDGAAARDLDRFFLCWTGVGLALITLSAWKHKHYAIPLLPPLSIYAALGLLRFVGRPRLTVDRVVFITACILVVAGIVGLAAGPVPGRGLVRLAAPAVLAGGVGLAVADACRRRGLVGRGLASAFAATWLAVVLAESLVMPRFDRYGPQKALALRLNDRVPPGPTIDLVALIDPQILFYLRPPMTFAPTLEAYRERLAAEGGHDGPRYVVGPAGIVAKMGEDGGEVSPLEAAVPPRGLTAIRVEPRAAGVVLGDEDRGSARR